MSKRIGSICDNIVDGTIVARNVKITGTHPIVEDCVFVESKEYGKYLARIEYLFEVSR